MADWHEDDGFWHAVEPALFSRQRFAAATTEVDAIVELMRIGAGARVLDLCCGPGRHAVELARRGYRVTGVDRVGRYLDRARAQATQWEIELELVEADMRDFERPAAFDVIVNLYTSFGYFADDTDDERVIQHIHRSLAPGGAVLIDLLGKEQIARSWRERSWTELDDGTILCEERRVADGCERLDSRWIIVGADGSRREVTGAQRIYSARELRELLGRAGFDRVDVYGSLDGAPHTADAERLVVVGRR